MAVELTTTPTETTLDLASDKAWFNDVSETPDAVNQALLWRFSQANAADIASAATLNFDTSTGDLVDVTGTTTVTAITLAEGRKMAVRFTGILILTNGASLVLPTAANITTAAGDYAIFRGYSGGVVRCAVYQRASGAALAGSGSMAIGGAVSGGTDKSVLFVDASGNLAQDNTNFKFTDASNILELDNGVLKVGGSMTVSQGSIGGVKLLDVANTVFGTRVFQYSNGEVPLSIMQTATPTANAFELLPEGSSTPKWALLAGGSMLMLEQTAPSAPAANNMVLYAVDNGSGKTQLMALFSSGAAQQVAIQP